MNSFNLFTYFGFGISNLGFISLKVYDILGNEIKTIINEINPAGYYDVEFDGSNLSSCIYYYSMEAGSFIETKRMMHVKLRHLSCQNVLIQRFVIEYYLFFKNPVGMKYW